MIGLPTSVISRMSSRETPASFASSAVSFARQPRTARVSSFSEPGFIITYETRLIRSSPKRICGFISPAEASTSPVARSQRCPATVVEPMSKAMPYDVSWKPGPDRGQVGVVVHRDGDLPLPRAQRLLQAREDVVVDRQPGQLPLALERLAETAEIARRRGEVGLLDLDVVEPDDGVDLDRVGVGLLAHDLLVHLALRRHVDHELALDVGGAAEPAARREALVGGVRPFHRTDRRQVSGGRR